MTVPAASVGLAPASVPLVEQKARTLVRDGKGHRVLALRAAPMWNGPEAFEFDGNVVHVRACVSSLAVREALTDRKADDWLVLITDRSQQDLGESLLSRFVGQRVHPLEMWPAVPGMFGAWAVAPDLRDLPWAAAALVEHCPSGGYPVATSGTVTRDHALGALTAIVLGLSTGTVDVPSLVQSTRDAAVRARWRSAEPDVRAGLYHWACMALGSAAGLTLDILSGAHALDAWTVGLACDALYPSQQQPAPAHAAAVRLEQYVGNRPLEHEESRRLADVARGMLLTCPEKDPVRKQVLAQAEQLLVDLGWADGARGSEVLPAGYVARLDQLAESIEAYLTEIQGASQVDLTLAQLLGHEAARGERADQTARAQMAVRLVRWLTRPPGVQPVTVQEALLQQAREDGWVDRASAEVWSGTTHAPLAQAYRALWQQVASRRREHDRRFGELLAQATSHDLLPAETLPIESLVTRLLEPLRTSTPVLLVVVDGMSTSVATQLTDDCLVRGWHELVPETDRQRTAALAVLPTMTTYSRTSLFAGELRSGTQVDEKRLFAWPLFHKDDLRSGAGQQLPPTVQAAIASEDAVVAVVLNAVDDALAKADPGGTSWRVQDVPPLSPLLDLAAAQGRVVVLTSDHGHVVERQTTAVTYPGADARYRPEGTAPADGEIAITGRRVLAESGIVVAAWAEDIRFGRKAAGYHGGVSAAEATIPVVVLTQAPQSPPPGWVEAPPQAPTWWHEQARTTAAPTPAPLTSKAKPVPDDGPTLFSRDQVAATSSERPADLATLVVGSDTFLRQRARAGRGALSDKLVEQVLRSLMLGGGRAHRDTVAGVAGVPVSRLSATLAVLRRMLNVEGYDVISLDVDGVTVLLDLALLREQFGVRG